MALANLFKKKSKASPAGDDEEGASANAGAPHPSFEAEEAYTMGETMLGASTGIAGDADPEPGSTEVFSIPLLGTRSAAGHQRVLSILLTLGLIVLIGAVYWSISLATQVTQQLESTGQSLMQAQRLAKSVSQAMLGRTEAFAEVEESSKALTANVHALAGSGDGSLDMVPLGDSYSTDMGKITPLADKAAKNTGIILGQQKTLTQISEALRTVSRQSSELLEVAETIVSLKLQQNASANEVAAVGQLVMLTQRIGKSANEFMTLEEVSPQAVFLLGKDLNTFKETARGLLEGNADLRLSPVRDEQTRERLTALLKMYEETRTQASSILSNLQGLVSAREAANEIVADSEPLRKGLEGLQRRLSSESGINVNQVLLLAVPVILVLLSAVGLAYVRLLESRQLQVVAERERQAAEHRQQEAKRVNDANQAAILRLMNELQTVAEGDLTQEATVTEDITGAIADSVNYTVEELRSLVGSVQNTATRVAQTTARVENTSTELLATSTEQLREIRETGQSVLDMANRINEVSTQAQESASVAGQSLKAAETGLTAVQNAIGGMNAIRDQIQETSKRIKRLGESSQEIGEITELISDITEQTNVLALNAAIQAASAGEAGRGFSVVAEEVQRLAERSGDATRQIATLVKAIQTDTQDAVAAMERSTQGVVEGARLSDSAGTALTEIDRVSRQLAELIQQISASALQEAKEASEVASNIQHIFAVTEQTGESTRTTATQVRDLARMADELRQTVSRFKIA
jgi:twitching motility protein PilJ